MTRWVVVGGGTAGCVVASRLSEVPTNEVILLEAGPDRGLSGPDDGLLLDNTDYLVPFSPYPAGFGLGGTSLINGTVAAFVPCEPTFDHLIPLEEADPGCAGSLGRATMLAFDDARPALLTRRGGLRVTVADAYIRPFLDRPNLTVRTSCGVDRIQFADRVAIGVVTGDGDHVAGDMVVVSAGAIATPTLLLRSGVDTPGVGEGLQDHAGVAISLELLEPAVGPIFSVVADRAGVQFLPMNHLPGRSDIGALLVALMDVESVGRVTVPDRDGPPVVDQNALSSPADSSRLAAAVADALAVVRGKAFTSIIGAAYIDDHGTQASTLDDEQAILGWLPTALGAYRHASSTCRVGVVTNADGSVRGYERLAVCDASLFQRVPTVNPLMTVIGLAERLTRVWCTV